MRTTRWLIRAIGMVWLAAWCGPAQSATLLFDDFSDTTVSSANWHIPTWTHNGDGTYVGRTQFAVTQDYGLPAAGGAARIIVKTFSKYASFYGTDLISNQLFAITPTQGLSVTFRARLSVPIQRGIVSGLFMYFYKNSSQHDEIDFELLGNNPGEVNTNIYGNEPLGRGHPQSTALPSGTIADDHTYQFIWETGSVSWYVDGVRVRAETSNVPAGPMYLHLNMWVPASNWPEAYDGSLQTAPNAAAGQTFTMSVDRVKVETYASASGNWWMYE